MYTFTTTTYTCIDIYSLNVAWLIMDTARAA